MNGPPTIFVSADENRLVWLTVFQLSQFNPQNEFLISFAVAASFLVIGVSAGLFLIPDNDYSKPYVCLNLKIAEQGNVRYKHFLRYQSPSHIETQLLRS